MAATNFKPEFTVCKTESDAFTGMIEKPRADPQKQRPPTSRQPAQRGARPSSRGNAAGQCRLLRTLFPHRYEIPSFGRRVVNPCGLYRRHARKNPRHERLHCDYTTAYKRIMGMPGRYECGEYQ